MTSAATPTPETYLRLKVIKTDNWPSQIEWSIQAVRHERTIIVRRRGEGHLRPIFLVVRLDGRQKCTSCAQLLVLFSNGGVIHGATPVVIH